MKVLHDMDVPHWSYLTTLKRGIKLILYSVFKPIGVRFKFIDDIYEEVRENADILIKLDKLVGVESVMGIKDDAVKKYPDIMEDLKKYDVDVREHIHIGDKKHRPFGWRQFSDPNRKRLWVPPLDQPKGTWGYDKDYIAGKSVMLKKGQLPIWHVGRPDLVKHYINFLYHVLIEGGQIYEEEL